MREQGVWSPVHGFPKLVYWGFAPKPFGRQAPVRRQYKNNGFLLREQMGFAKSMVFSGAGTKGASSDSSKTMIFLLREGMGVSKTTKGMRGTCRGGMPAVCESPAMRRNQVVRVLNKPSLFLYFFPIRFCCSAYILLLSLLVVFGPLFGSIFLSGQTRPPALPGRTTRS